jgi:biopolymer transport protein ExbD
MRIRPRRQLPAADADMTPMIDVTFQLIAFFMFVLSFTDAEQDERIKLPVSELAKPPDAPFESPITLQLTRDGEVIVAGELVGIDGVERLMQREGDALQRRGKSPSTATVIIRAHQEAATGQVQELIRKSQSANFINFVLRAKERGE